MADAALPAREAAARWTRLQWGVIAVLLLVNFVSGMDRMIMSILMQPMKGDLRLTDTELGLITGPAFSIFYAVSAIPIARFAERFSREKLLAGLLTVWSSATVLCSLAVNVLSVGLCRVGVGLGEGGAHPICQSIIADKFDARQRGTAMSIYACGPPVAAIVAPILAGIVAEVWGWRTAFAVIGAPGLLLAVLVWFSLADPATREARRARRLNFVTDFRDLIRNPTFVFIFLAGAFNGIGITATTAFAPSFVMRTQGLKLSEAGGVVALMGVLGLAGVLVGGWLADRFSDARGRSYLYVPAFGAALSLVAFELAFTQAAWSMVLVGLLVANLATDLKSGPCFAAIQNAVPSHMRATAAATFTIAANVIGAGTGGLIVGALSDGFTARAFGPGSGGYHAACLGAEKAAALADACAAASADGLRTALALVSLVFAGAAVCFLLASRCAKPIQQ